MKLTSKQRASFRSLAQNLSPIVMVGKEGRTEAVIKALDEALSFHELVKVKFQNFKDEFDSISRGLEEETSSTLISTTGFTAVYFRQTEKKEDRKFSHLLK